MTAAIYALRAKKTVALIERLTPGGQILNTTKIENYPGLLSVSGQEFAEKLREQVKKFGGEFVSAEVLGIEKTPDEFKIKTDDGLFTAKTVIIANGSKERALGLLEEEKYIGKGVSYCATCDGALFKDKTVAVYGGGNTAAYSVLYLSGLCKKVYWIFRKPEPRAEKHLIRKAEETKNVEILNKTVIEGLNGEEKLTGLTLIPCLPEEPGVDYLVEAKELKVDGLFVLIGREPDNKRFGGLIELDEAGYIKSDESCKTSQKGVFCAGDTREKKLNQLVTATADGAVAASAAIDYLNNK